MNRCRYCIHWKSTQMWKGNCQLHPWEGDKYSEDADASGCLDYVDRYGTPQHHTIMASSKEA